MRKHFSRLLAIFLVVVTVVAVLAVPASAATMGYYMDCKIYYKSEDGATVAPTMSFSVNAAESSSQNVSYASPTIAGYSLKNDGDAVVTFGMMNKSFPASHYVRQGSATYTVYYVKNVSSTIYYVYGSSMRTAAPSKTVTGKSGDTYTVTSPNITGYTAAPLAVRGSYGGGNKTVYYYEKSYTVNFDANGGSGAPLAQVKYYFSNLTLSSDIPTRSGYLFKGWSTSAGSLSASYQPGDTYRANSGITLYAVWSPKTYTVSYDANGGSGAPSNQTKTHGVSLTLSMTTPTRSGYTFLGWGAVKSATTATYRPGSTFTGNYSRVFYAVWKENVVVPPPPPMTYAVTYNANGGSGAPAAQTKTHDVALTLSSQTPERYGYVFKGWSSSSTATSASYYAGSSYTSNASVTLYAVWEQEIYTISYNANGGSGAPARQTKTSGQSVAISRTVPTRTNHAFLGWATSSTATSPEYYGGETYYADASVTLYAVWQERNYDFSVSDLVVTPDEVYQHQTVTIKFRLDSWDRNVAYSDIPVEVLLNGSVIYSTRVNFAAYGVQNIVFNLDVGALEGEQSLTARVNWADHYNETRTYNNDVSETFTVKKYMETSVSTVSTNGEYIEGFTVISSFYVKNEGTADIVPDDHMTFDFEVYTTSGGSDTMVFTTKKNDVVIPAGGTNLVYFKWRVPVGSAGTTFYCRGKINMENASREANSDNNTTEYAVTSQRLNTSQTPNTRFERTAPAGYTPSAVSPNEKVGSATWNEWVYVNGGFELRTFGVQVTAEAPIIEPSASCKTATKVGSVWKMGSGYGLTFRWTASLTAGTGKLMPSGDAFTSPQQVYATFPEYSFSTVSDKYRTLEYADGAYRFEINADADKNERVHFVPVYVQNGSYAVSVTATQIWTPAGMITATRNTNAVAINGTVYDDYYVGG